MTYNESGYAIHSTDELISESISNVYTSLEKKDICMKIVNMLKLLYGGR